MRFKYLAKKGPSEKIEGILNAGSLEQATKILIQQGLSPLQIEEVKDTENVKISNETFKVKKIKQQQLLEFTRNLYNLLKAHIGMLKALLIIGQQADKVSTKKLIEEIYNRVKEGENFSSVLEQFSSVFSPFYISLVKVGEVSGRLEFALEKICEYLEQRQEMRRKVASSLAYPLMMIIVGIGTTIVLFTFVIPRLSGLFTDLGQELPVITKILLACKKRYFLIFLYISEINFSCSLTSRTCLRMRAFSLLTNLRREFGMFLFSIIKIV